jgi:hypothetical protein
VTVEWAVRHAIGRGAMRLVASVALCCAALSFASASAAAAESAEGDKGAPSPELQRTDHETVTDELILGHHLFQFPMLQPSSFMTTHVSSRLGLALVRAPDSPVVPGQTFDVDALGVSERLGGSVRFLDRFELFATGNANAYAGTAAESVIVGGAGWAYGGEGGLGFRIFKGESTQLSARAWFGGGTARRVQVLTLLSAAFTGQPETLPNIVNGNVSNLVISKVTNTEEALAFSFAQCLGRALGLQVTAALSHTFLDVRLFSQQLNAFVTPGVNVWTPDLAFALDFDLRRLVPAVPIAFLAEYDIQWSHAHDDYTGISEWLDTANTLAGGIYYSGRPELQLGLSIVGALPFETTEGFSATGRPFPAGRTHEVTFLLPLRYTW